MLVPS
jgi:hypothetical protein